MKDNNATMAVLNYLKKHKRGITQMQCINMFGNTRLSAIIFNLKRKGYNIERIDEEHVTRYGIKTRVGRYVLRGE